MTETETTTIIIEVEGGVVQSVIGVPRGVTVQINDYDTEGADPNDLTTLQDGSEVYVGEYHGN